MIVTGPTLPGAGELLGHGIQRQEARPRRTCSFRSRRSSAGRDNPILAATSQRPAGITAPRRSPSAVGTNTSARWISALWGASPSDIFHYRPRPRHAPRRQEAPTRHYLATRPGNEARPTLQLPRFKPSLRKLHRLQIPPIFFARETRSLYARWFASGLVHATPRVSSETMEIVTPRSSSSATPVCRSSVLSETLVDYVENVLICIELILTCPALRI